MNANLVFGAHNGFENGFRNIPTRTRKLRGKSDAPN